MNAERGISLSYISYGSATLGLVDLTLTPNEAPAEPWDSCRLSTVFMPLIRRCRLPTPVFRHILLVELT